MRYCRKLARLNSFTYASRNLITVRLILQRSSDVAYTPRNSSSSFEVSAILWDGNFDDFRVYTTDGQSIL